MSHDKPPAPPPPPPQAPPPPMPAADGSVPVQLPPRGGSAPAGPPQDPAGPPAGGQTQYEFTGAYSEESRSGGRHKTFVGSADGLDLSNAHGRPPQTNLSRSNSGWLVGLVVLVIAGGIAFALTGTGEEDALGEPSAGASATTGLVPVAAETGTTGPGGETGTTGDVGESVETSGSDGSTDSTGGGVASTGAAEETSTGPAAAPAPAAEPEPEPKPKPKPRRPRPPKKRTPKKPAPKDPDEGKPVLQLTPSVQKKGNDFGGLPTVDE